jgi:dienelactone hydrolase
MRSWRRVGPGLIALALGLSVAGCGGGDAGTASASSRPAPSPFAYDASAPLGLRDRGVVNRPYPIAIHDVSFASPRGGRVPGYLAVPPGKGPFPAVVYLHGSGGNRLELLPLATWMAARGAVALTIDAPDARPGAAKVGTGLAGLRRTRSLYVQEVVDLRRAVDLLQSLPYVDGRRVAYVGYSAGARMGAILAAYEPRIRAFDLMSGGGLSTQAYVKAAPAADRKAVAAAFAGLDDLVTIRRARADLFFQDGSKDRVVPHGQLVALARAAPQPKRVRWYPADHNLNRRAIHDQLDWLAHELGLRGPIVKGAVAGP